MFWTLTNTAASLQRPAIPPGPLPFDTTYWKPVALKGAWAPSTSYSRYDGVSYGTNNYVCILDTAGSTTTPDIDTHNWGKTTSRGAWVSGTQYSAFNAVTYNSQTYFTQYPISGGSGLDLVRVVPNPYDIRARLLQFGDVANQADRIMFYGLPAQAKLKIFTERGDLVNEINHTSGTGDERWDVASGIYILYVERSDGSKVIRKFVIIR